MVTDGHLGDAIVILAAAVAAQLAFQRLRLSPVLGYLAAGAVLGPFGLRLIGDVDSALALAEFGVVFLLFSVGLELPLERLRVLPPALFGLGAAQVLATAAVFAGAALAFGLAVDAAVAVGCALALSSTVFVVQILIERRRLATRMGRAAFTVLLCQDLAIAPILVVTLALVDRETGLGAALGIAALKAAAAVLFIVVLGRYVVRPLFRLAAVGQSAETFAAATLLAVLCTAALTELAGLSLALGGLLAGMLLAETEYRHQVAAEIQPFRGILVGLFFMTVGMSADLGHAWSEAAAVAAVVAGLLALKAAVLGALALLFGLPAATAWPVGLLLAQGGEFSFVVLGIAAGGGLLDGESARILVVAVALSMLLTPLLAALATGSARRGAARAVADADLSIQPAPEASGHVVVAGYGRVGRAAVGGLAARGIPHIAIDRDPYAVARARRQGETVFFGDATRPEVLEALHVGRARAVVVALSDPEAATRLVGILGALYPGRPVLARAETEDHARELAETGADEIVPELVATGDRLAALVPDSADSPDAPDSENPEP